MAPLKSASTPTGSTWRRLRPTFTQAGAARYRRTGGPWDRGALDASFPAGPGATVVDGTCRLDAAALEAGIADVAGRLATIGVRRGDVVSWQLPNGAAPLFL